MSRVAVWSLYALLVCIWSSTWVAIKLGLEDTPALLGAGIRFGLAGALLLAFAAASRRSLKTDWGIAALLAVAPFALAYGLIYWGEQHVPSGLAAVLFAGLPLYVALGAGALIPEEPLSARLLVGVAICISGIALAFGESIELGADDLALAGAIACTLAPIATAVGNLALKLRSKTLDPIVLNGWAMGGCGLLLLAGSAIGEDWGDARWTANAALAIGYLAIVGSAIAFVGLTVLFRELPAVTTSFISLIIPFGALLFGAALADEPITLPALGGAVLVAAGLAVAQRPRRDAPESAPEAAATAPRSSS